MDKTKAAVAVFDKYATEYQEKFMDTSLYHHTFDAFCDAVAIKNAAILDVACGPGNITRYLLDRRPDFKILGTDLAPRMIALAKTNNPEAEFSIMDCRDIAVLPQKFDGIMCGFCLPYLSKEQAGEMIRDAAAQLNPHGVLYLSTMEDSYETSGLETSSRGEQVYMHYHEAGYLQEFLSAYGLTVIDIQHLANPHNKGTITDLIIIAVK